MPERDHQFLELAKRRNVLIPQLIAKNEVYQKRSESLSQAVRILSYVFILPKSSLKGQENLEHAQQIRDEGFPLIVVSNHTSDLDHPARRAVLERNGYRSLADSLVYVAGLKMIERKYVKLLVRGEGFVLIPTPFDAEKLDSALNQQSLYTEEEQEYLGNLRTNYRIISEKARRTVKSLTEDGYHNVAWYPESTRSRNGGLIQKSPEVTSVWYFFLKDSYILPISIKGGHRLLPPEREIWAIPSTISIRVGKPYSTGAMIETARSLPRESQRDFLANYPLATIAELEPDLVDPRMKNYFEELIRTGKKITV